MRQHRRRRYGAAASASRGDTYNFEFADTTLTPDRLNAIQQRRDALARVGRPH